MITPQPIFELGTIEHCWAEVRLRNRDGDEFGGSISDLSDGLREFIAAVELVVTGRLFGAICGWAVEPGHWLVTVRLAGVARIALTVGYVGDDLQPLPSMRDPLFSATVDARELARDVVRAYRYVLTRYGPDSWFRHWDLYPFPRTELDSLSTWLDGDGG